MITCHTQCKIATSDNEIIRLACRELAATINTRLTGLEIDIKRKISELIQEAIRNSPVYIALSGGEGKLRTQLGIVSPKADMDFILRKMIQGINVTPLVFNSSGTKFTAQLTATAIASDFIDLLSSGLGVYTSTNTQGKSTEVEWLKWLLTKGTADIIVGYIVKENVPDYSRTQDAIMVKNKSRAWFMPVDYAGTVEDNFITRATDTVKANERLADYIIQQIKARLS
jgi:hypothetical protein